MWNTFFLHVASLHIFAIVIVDGSSDNWLGTASSSCVETLCPQESALKLWSNLQPFCYPSKVDQHEEFSRRLDSINFFSEGNISTLFVGILCAIASVLGIVFGIFSARRNISIHSLPSLLLNTIPQNNKGKVHIETTNW